MYLEVVANNSSTTPNSENTINFEAINRSNQSIILKAVSINSLNISEEKNLELKENNAQEFSLNVVIPSEINFTFPYWLHKKGTLGMYKVENEDLISLPETPKEIKAEFVLDFNGYTIPFSKEIIYKYNDPVKGEVYKPFEILPEEILPA